MTSTVKIALNGEFTATELEEILRDLMQARAGMTPPVPMQPPGQDQDAQVLVQDETSFIVRTLASGGLRFWLRNEGIGWLALAVPKTTAEGLATFLTQKRGGSYTLQ